MRDEIYDPTDSVEGLKAVIVGVRPYCEKKVNLKETLNELEKAKRTDRESLQKGSGVLQGCGNIWFCSQKCADNYYKYKRTKQ